MQESIKRANGSRRGGGGVTAGVRACDHTSVGGRATAARKGGRGGYRHITVYAYSHMGASERARLYVYL